MENRTAMKDKIAKTLASSETPMHIKDIASNFNWIPESTVRGRLNDNVGKLFDRVGKGLYILKWDKWSVWLINWDARTLDDKFDENSVDLLLSDHAWLDEKSHKGGNRNFAWTYDCFKYEEDDFKQKYKVLKEGWFLVEFLPEKNANNKKYLREIEDLAEKAWLKYFAEVSISGWNSNIWRKKKSISSAYFFTKGEARKLKIWDEKLSKLIKEWEMKFMKKEYMVDFKKVYSEVLNVNTDSIDRTPTSFDIKISKDEAEYIIKEMKLNEQFKWATVMCKEYWEDDDWQEVNWEDLHDYNNENKFKLDNDYKTFELMIEENNKDNVNNIIWLINKYNNENNVLVHNFLHHKNKAILPQFKKYNKVVEKMQELYHYKKNSIMNNEQEEEFKKLEIDESNFHNAINEYIEFLKKSTSYKMWTKTILPEFYIWDNLSKKDKRHESQKPLNTLEEIIEQTTKEWEIAVEQFAWSFVWAEAILNLWKEWKWWRNYVWIELDKERVDNAKKYLHDKYKDLKLYTIDDFYSICSNQDIDLIKSKWWVKHYKKLEVVTNKINTDLEWVLKITFLQFKLEDDLSLSAKNFNSDTNRILSICFFWKSNMKEENRVLTVIANKDDDRFEIVNWAWKIINKSNVWGNLDESLVKVYNSFI